MNSALSPREIQARLRAGASVPEVAAEAGVEVQRIEGFALPVMAERAHMTRTALGASVRRRGDASGHRRLGEIVRERLQARGLDADTVEWDAWRQNDLKWRLVGLLDDQAASRAAEFVFDPKGRFSFADNADARWMIGETLPGPQTDPDNENTIDFNDELALVRAISDGALGSDGATGRPGDDVPSRDALYEGAGHTSELDELYDMLSGVSEDSVRIYLGLDDAKPAEGRQDHADETLTSTDDEGRSTGSPTVGATPSADESESAPTDEVSERPDLPASATTDSTDLHDVTTDAPEHPQGHLSAPPTGEAVEEERSTGPDAPLKGGVADEQPDSQAATSDPPSGPASGAEGASGTANGPAGAAAPADPRAAPEQDPLVPDPHPASPKRTPAKKRASIPSWDEIMFGGPSRS